MVTLSDIRKENMILRLPSSGTRNLFVSAIEQMNMTIEDFQVILEVDNIATIKDLIRKDLGISILAKSACIDEIKKGKIGRALLDTTISGVAFDMLKTVDMVSDAVEWESSGFCGKKQPMPVGLGGPSIRCKVMIGGR